MKNPFKGLIRKNSIPDSEFYKVVLTMAGIEYKAESMTIDGALEALGLSWEQIKAKGVITVSKGSSSYEMLFYPKQLKRIFANKLTRMMWGKRLQMLLESKTNDHH